jgi:predicted CXXCH cytochrome family protein
MANPFPLSPGRWALPGLFVAFLAVLAAGPAAAELPVEEDALCFECHGDPELVSEETGRSLYVDEDKYSRSPHAENGCVSCHQDVDPEDLPHDVPLAEVSCGDCHDDVAEVYAGSTHGKALAKGDPDAPKCWDCHGAHDILPPDDMESRTYVANIPKMCGACHREDSEVVSRHHIAQPNVVSNYSMSIHGEGLFRRGLRVTAVCTSCHTAHNVRPHEDPQSTINRANIAKTCMQCHAQIEQVHLKVIRGELWEKEPHRIPACVDCHKPHQIRRVFYEDTMDDAFCLGCHGKPDIVRVRDGKVDTLFVNVGDLLASAHGPETPCIRCHTNMDIRKDPVCKDSGKVDCSACHAQQVADYESGIHGQLYEQGDPNAPYCTDCHGTHRILPRKSLNSPIFPRNIPDLCAMCHREGEKAAVRYKGPEREIVKHYNMSIHGKGLRESGLMVTAVCSSCHTAHRELPAKDPLSSVNRAHVAETCAQCHLGIYEEFKSSVHSPTVTKTDKKLPVCYDCHRSHTIERVDKPDFRQEILKHCGGCHEDVTETYFDTFHGKVSKLGYVKAAKCYDCHGSHNILPPEDPRSTLSPRNIVETCRQCHPESNRKFTGYLTHATHHDRVKYPILFFTFWAMTSLLIGTFAFFWFHTLLWLPRSLRERRRLKQLRAHAQPVYVQRFETFPRALHIIVIVSFLGLALTGMTLKFAGQPWAVYLARIMGGFESTGTIHRFCAILTFTYFFLHFVHVRRKKRESGLSWWQFLTGENTLLPKKRDFVEFWQTMKWFFGLGPRPNYGRWTYWEKFDYLAVFWGVAVIGTTGLMLWFPEQFTKVLPGYLINVATIIHSDEALLATGFIFTVHFFNTHFRPEKFPMDPVIFTGAVHLEELKHDRPREYEALVREGLLEKRRVEPPPRWLSLGGRIFGFLALTTGIALIVMILWSMLFQYR